MLGVIFNVMNARAKHCKLAARRICSQESNLAGRMAVDCQQQELAAARALYGNVEARVCLFINQRVGLGRSHAMPPSWHARDLFGLSRNATPYSWISSALVSEAESAAPLAGAGRMRMHAMVVPDRSVG